MRTSTLRMQTRIVPNSPATLVSLQKAQATTEKNSQH